MKTAQEYVQLAANLRNLSATIQPKEPYAETQQLMQYYLNATARMAEAIAHKMAFGPPQPETEPAA